MKNILEIIKEKLEKYIGDSSYKKNVLTMVGGRIVAQVLPILIMPLFTRIYSPEQFGIFAVYGTIVSIVAMLSNGRYCLAIILPKEREKALDLMFLSGILTIITTCLFGLVLFFQGIELFTILNVEILNNYILLIILSVLFIGLYEPLFYFSLREKRYKLLASNVVWQASALIISRLLLGYLGYGDSGLILSSLISYIISFFLLFERLKISFKGQKKGMNVSALLKKYINFPKFSLLADSLGNLTNSIPNVLLAKAFGSIATGHFSLSDKVLGSPIWLVTSSVGDVFKQEASEQYRMTGSCEKVFRKTSKTLFILGIIPFILIFFLVPPLIPFVFGEIWNPVGEYIRIFSIMYFSSFVVGPTAYIVYIVGKQNYAILFQAIKLISIIISFVIGYHYSSLFLGLILWSILVTLSNFFVLYFSYKFAKETKK